MDGLKTPFVTSANRLAVKRAFDAIQALGKALPCTIVGTAGQIVTVKIEANAPPFTLSEVTVPIATTINDWIPVKAGDAGVLVPAAAYLGGISGIGGGTANLAAIPANLEALVFLPVSNAAWAAPGGDPAVRVVQGPDGVLLQDYAETATIKITSGAIIMSAGGHNVTISAAGVIIDGRVFLFHMHTLVMSGSDDSGPVQ